MIVERILEAKERKIKQWPVRSNRASELGHPCLRYLVLNRTRWQEKALHDTRLQMIFDMGNMIEEAVMADLREAGIQVIEQQRAFSWDKYQITGHIDCKLQIEDSVYPCEIKSAAPYTFDSINTLQDMANHRYPYIRQYPGQIMLYLLMDGKERGLILFKNKTTGALKEVWVDLDYEIGEGLVKKAEAINLHVDQGTLPEQIEYEELLCGECGYAHICLPERIGTEVKVVDDGRLLELLTEYDSLKAGAKRFKQVDEQINELVKGQDKLLVGDWFVQGKWLERTNYAIPDDVKAQYAEKTQYWRKQIIPVEGSVLQTPTQTPIQDN